MKKLLIGAALATSLLAGCGPSEAPSSPPVAAEVKSLDMGLTKDQIIDGVGEWLHSLESAPLDKGVNRLMGRFDTAKAATIIEFIGADATRPHKVALLMLMPNDAPAIVLGNVAIYGAVTKNLFPGWSGDERLEWLSSSVKTLTKAKPDKDGNIPKLTKELDGKILTLSVAESLGMVTLTIRNKDVPA